MYLPIMHAFIFAQYLFSIVAPYETPQSSTMASQMLNTPAALRLWWI